MPCWTSTNLLTLLREMKKNNKWARNEPHLGICSHSQWLVEYQPYYDVWRKVFTLKKYTFTNYKHICMTVCFSYLLSCNRDWLYATISGGQWGSKLILLRIKTSLQTREFFMKIMLILCLNTHHSIFISENRGKELTNQQGSAYRNQNLWSHMCPSADCCWYSDCDQCFDYCPCSRSRCFPARSNNLRNQSGILKSPTNYSRGIEPINLVSDDSI